MAIARFARRNRSAPPRVAPPRAAAPGKKNSAPPQKILAFFQNCLR